MIRSLLPYFFTAVAAVMLRDLECYLAAKIFCWRRRRASQREAKENHELRRIAAEFAAKEKAEREQKRRARIMAAIPHPNMLRGPLVINANCDRDFTEITAAIHANFAVQGKTIVNADFENN